MSIITADNLHKEFALKLKGAGSEGAASVPSAGPLPYSKKQCGGQLCGRGRRIPSLHRPQRSGQVHHHQNADGHPPPQRRRRPDHGTCPLAAAPAWRHTGNLRPVVPALVSPAAQDGFDLLARIYEVPYRDAAAAWPSWWKSLSCRSS